MDNLKMYKSIKIYTSRTGERLYETTDGKIFKDLQEAKNYEYPISLFNNIEKFVDEIFFEEFIDKEEIVQAIENNWKEFFALLKKYEKYIDV